MLANAVTGSSKNIVPNLLVDRSKWPNANLPAPTGYDAELRRHNEVLRRASDLRLGEFLVIRIHHLTSIASREDPESTRGRSFGSGGAWSDEVADDRPRAEEAAMILVVGGTGDLGGRIVRRLIEGGQEVRCVVRAGSDASALREMGASIVTGDLVDAESLEVACEGVDVVVASATAIGRRLAGAKGPKIREADELGMASLIQAAETSGVRRFVYVSYAGADRSLGTPLERAKVATERRLAASPMRRVVVRPDAFQDLHLAPIGRFDLHSGKVAVFGKGDTKRRWVAADDVAALVAAVTSESDPPELIEFGGPEALSRNEAIAVAERATGRSFKVQRVPLPVARLGMKIFSRPNDALASIFGTGVMQDVLQVTWDDAPLRERGITPRSATEWIHLQAGTS
jgi:uncharacterized protein YbjT (DUF2867 family)